MRLLPAMLYFATGLAGLAAEPLCDAIRANRLDEVRSASKDAKTVHCQGHPALQYATAVGSLDAMKLLLDAGADVNAADPAGATALIWSVSNIDRVRLLLDRGADPNSKSKAGMTAFLVAASNPGSLEILRLLASRGADPKAQDGNGSTALRNAAHALDFEMVKYLAAQGIDVNAANKFGDTAILEAASGSNLALIEFLISKGANVNDANKLAGKVKHGDIALVGLTPLMLAVPYASPEFVRVLLDAGASLNARDSRGMTALMFAVSTDSQNPKNVRLLLKRGADPALKDQNGDTALDWARKIGNPVTIRLLKGSPLAPAAASQPAVAGDPSAALSKGFALLQKSGDTFFKESGCPACHHVNTTAIASAVMRQAGHKIDETLAGDLLKVTKLRFQRIESLLMQRQDPGGAVDTISYAGMALAAGKTPPEMATDAMAIYAAMCQSPNGKWERGGITRPPMEDSPIHTTAVAIRLLRAYGPPARQAEWDGRIARAKRWLAAARPANNDDRSMQILGLLWAGASPSELKPFMKALASRQRKNGGWSQNDWLASDAYATGQALYALAEAGHRDDKLRAAGSAFLVATQKDDGSWYVRSRSPKFQPYFESGFPYGGDQWISNAATAWATMGLARR